jgi:hypothetical protein
VKPTCSEYWQHKVPKFVIDTSWVENAATLKYSLQFLASIDEIAQQLLLQFSADCFR